MKNIIILGLLLLFSVSSLAQSVSPLERESFRKSLLDKGVVVDLGLPSGVLWYAENMGGNNTRYYYQEAVNLFGDKLPTEEQFKELKNLCTWIWMGDGYKVVGPNGNSIYLAAMGFVNCHGDLLYVGKSGSYWSSKADRYIGKTRCSTTLDFNDGLVWVYNAPVCFAISVRLVLD